MLQSKTTETIVGAFIAVGLGALLVLALRVSNLNLATFAGQNLYTLRAQFDNIGGLKVRSPVKMSGITIGRVADIVLDPASYTAIAVMEIEKRYHQIPDDTIAHIYTAGLLGEQYVSLEAGGSEQYFKAGALIVDTQSAVVLEQVIGQFLYSKAAEGGSETSKPAD